MQQVTRQEKVLGLSEALEIAARHNVAVLAKPIVFRSWNSMFGQYAKLYLPGYILTIEIDKNGKEKVTVEPANDCFCNCDSGPSDDLVW